MTNNRAVLSIDFEFFTHTPAYRKATGSTEDRSIGLDGVDFLLELLADAGVKATFFIVSEIAAEFPDVIREIANRGHEIGSHGRTHTALSSLDAVAVGEEITSSRSELEAVADATVTGFRAPVFELANDHFRLLQDAGYRYDSSIAPCRRIPGFYGGQFSEQRPQSAAAFSHEFEDDILELPVSVMPTLRLPLSGAWLRLFGRRYTAIGMRRLARRDITPILYLHPWELVDLPTVEGVPRRVYWHTGQWMQDAIRQLLAEPYEFVTAQSELEHRLS